MQVYFRKSVQYAMNKHPYVLFCSQLGKASFSFNTPRPIRISTVKKCEAVIIFKKISGPDRLQRRPRWPAPGEWRRRTQHTQQLTCFYLTNRARQN